MKLVPFITGIATGMVVSVAAVTAMYPDVSRRMMRDGKKMIRNGKKMVNKMF